MIDHQLRVSLILEGILDISETFIDADILILIPGGQTTSE
jgi:hypothetical protein